PLDRQSSTTISTIASQSGRGTVEVVVVGGTAVVVGGTLVVGAAVVVGAVVVVTDTTVVVGGLVVVGVASVVVGATGAVVSVRAVSEISLEQAETKTATARTQAPLRFMV
ncbi:MAG: hypothetical protein VX992_07515, partial [Acidobacteriota bacterium]|nr:hypothetical protein [Acidobacteriota bacterium]